jgi:AraC-like DNA-binding protein
MKELQFDPFIRFAMKITLRKQTPLSCAYDSHLYLVTAGSGKIDTEDKVYDFSEGDVIFVPAGCFYSFAPCGECELISINFDFTKKNKHITDPIYPKTKDEYNPASSLSDIDHDSPLCNFLVLRSSLAHSELIKKTALEFEYKKNYYKDAASAYLKSALIELCRILDGPKPELCDKILAFIGENFAKPLTNAKIAAHFGYHPYHVNRIMRSCVGTTIHSYLIRYRIDEAKHMLEGTSLSVGEIAALCGYSNLCTFSSEFKRRVGSSPLEYREIVSTRK